MGKSKLFVAACLILCLLSGGLVLGAGTRASGPESDVNISLPIPELDLLPAERAWLERNGSVRIAGPRSFPPFHYYDDKKKLQGISADYILTMMEQLGLEVEIMADLPWPRVLEMARAGDIDLIPCAAKTADREGFLSFSSPYLSFPLVILSRKDAPFIGGIEDLYGKRLAVIEKNAVSSWLRRDGIDYDPLYVDSPFAGLEAVSLGRADARIENMAAASYLIQKFGMIDLKIAAPTPYGNYDLHMAVRKDLPELLGIVNKVIDLISPEQHMQFRSRWLSVRYEHGIKPSDIVAWISGILLLSGGIIAFVVVWNRRLNREVRERKLAQAALAESEERFREMADLLPGAILELDRDLTITYVNQHGMALFGYGPAEIKQGVNALDLLHPDDRARAEARVESGQAGDRLSSAEYRLKERNGKSPWILINASFIQDEDGMGGYRCVLIDISGRKEMEKERERLILDLRNALAEIKVLQGFIPICAHCKKIRDDTGYWEQIETYIQERTDTRFSHGICPDCSKKFYPNLSRNRTG